MANYLELIKQISDLKDRILEIDKKSIKLSETDTRQGLINPLFRSLGWDFGDFTSIRSEFRNKKYNEPVDYAFFATKNGNIPILLLEAKQYGKNLEDPKTVKQLCNYLGEMGTQWGVLSDGNHYIMYNSKGGLNFEDQKYLSLQLKTVDTDDGITSQKIAEHLDVLLSRKSLEDETIQSAYEEHIVHSQIERAFESLLSEPFKTLVNAIRTEFKQTRVRANPKLRLTNDKIEEYLKSISDEGRIAIEREGKEIHSDEEMVRSITEATQDTKEKDNGVKTTVLSHGKRITIKNLLEEKLIYEGDNWKMDYKGDVYWGRITGNGEVEIDGKTFQNPSKAGNMIMIGGCNGWFWWHYKTKQNDWDRIDVLRQQYRGMHIKKSGQGTGLKS